MTERRRSLVAALAVMLSLIPAAAAGQIAWDAPRMIGPESPGGLGVYWLRGGSLPGDGDAVLATWALPGAGRAVSVRGGFGTGAGGEPAGFGGVDIRAPLARHSDTQPLDLSWNAGAGLGVGEYVLVSVPVGVAAGRSWSSGAVWFAPWVGAGVALDLRIGSEAPEEEFDVQGSGEVGFDLAFDQARRFVIRVAASLGDRQAIAVGMAIGGGS